MNVLIVGGYGTFGGRLADLIRDDPRLTIIVAGRSREAAEAFCASRQVMGQAQLLPETFDRKDSAGALQRLKPDIVVDASGPFQVYGEDPYNLVRDTIAAGAHYRLCGWRRFCHRHLGAG